MQEGIAVQMTALRHAVLQAPHLRRKDGSVLDALSARLAARARVVLNAQSITPGCLA